jgi:phosphatidylserine/phosphatidylglycerophosphate/cardiolipin synthase-like enzyme
VLTSEVVSGLIDEANERVTVVSFAAYAVPSVLAALDAAATRGVHVRLILESPEKLKDGGGAGAYAAFPTYEWPVERRVPPDALLHAKAVIVDGHAVLVTSANLTNAAYDKSIELGVLCRGGGVANQIQHHFDALIAAGVLRPVT